MLAAIAGPKDHRLTKEQADSLLASGILADFRKATFPPDARDKFGFAFDIPPYSLSGQFPILDRVNMSLSFHECVMILMGKAQGSRKEIRCGGRFSEYDFPPVSYNRPHEGEYVLARLDREVPWDWLLRFWEKDGLVPADFFDLCALIKYAWTQKKDGSIASAGNWNLNRTYAPGSVIEKQGSDDRFFPFFGDFRGKISICVGEFSREKSGNIESNFLLRCQSS